MQTLTDQIAAVLKAADVVPTRDVPEIATALAALPLIREAEAMREAIGALEGHVAWCRAIKGPYPENWTGDEDCDCGVTAARAVLARVEAP